MSRSLGRALALVVTGFAVAVAGSPAPASAKVLERDAFHDEFDVVIEDFCETEGLTVDITGTVDGRFQGNARGSEGLAYFIEHVVVERVVTNQANGESVRDVQRTMTKDLRVTDNGDGTLTILVLATGNATMYGDDGKAIARNPGQVRFELLIDNAGTPSDPSDDEFLDFLGLVKGSTGRSDDFCSAAVAAIA